METLSTDIQNRPMSKVWLMVLIAIMTAILSGGLTYYLTNKKAQTEKETLNKQISDLQRQIDQLITSQNSQVQNISLSGTTVSDSTSADPTADWKMYTSTMGSYTIKYPPTWVYKELTSDQVAAIGDITSETLFFINQADQDLSQTQTQLHQIAILTSTTNKTLDQATNDWQNSIKSESGSSTANALTTGTNQLQKIQVAGSNQTIYLMVEKNILFDMELGMSDGAESQKDPTTVEQMMGTIAVY